MPDIDPAALSRPAAAGAISTPTLSTKSISLNAAGGAPKSKTSQIVPPRIDLEPYYAAVKAFIPPDKWVLYKETVCNLAYGRLNQSEFSAIIDPLVTSASGEREHLHNRLILAIIANVTREMPDQGVAPWVSADDKPAVPTGSKPVTGDAAERRLKVGVMQLPAKDRRRIKEMVHNDIRKRFNQPLAIESGEFPDVGTIGGRMLPFCYEAGLVSGHTAESPQLMSVATETFIKDVLTQIFSRTRSNGPGEAGSSGFGVGTTWVQTHQYSRQLHAEEDLAQSGKLMRDKNGLLPVEAKAACERGALSMADVRVALEMGDTGMATFPIITTQILYGYKEGELENWSDYTYYNDQQPPAMTEDDYDSPFLTNGAGGAGAIELIPNGADIMDIDSEPWWEGAEGQDIDSLDGLLDSCLTASS
ncbi:transcriptional coactivator HFI1/ADA1 [Geosmithia morbida]|uniref:Transcriptional coactivator HFI1/ADA1 n=1 Tax=Geosmithia morbida TaxID=1094350 RepID=A0A9P5CZZ8_9HYPO|nr:transcriptional coactivator HFI1/ADA1 [Geosmithia morbida]KAF4121067.1 transcriptional coactivator HFI1/ADA1 [Geosmithia morbida]